MKKFSVMMTFILFVSIGMLGTASAVPFLDFGVIPSQTGSISYAGGAAPLVGAGIYVDNVVGLDTPANNNVALRLFNADLDFTTGASNGVWTWGGGPNSSVILTGGVDINRNNFEDAGDIASGTQLMWGTFEIDKVTDNGNHFKIAGSGFMDYKLAELLDFYGLPTELSPGIPMPYAGNFNISFNAGDTGLGTSFSSTRVLSGDITNTPVPEPATMLLLGSGLVGLVSLGRKKFAKKA